MQGPIASGLKGRGKFIVGGLLILAAVVYLIVMTTKNNMQFFTTVNELKSNESGYIGRSLQISGAVVGSTIKFDPNTNNLTFEIANVPGDNATIAREGGLAKVLHEAVVDPSRARLTIVYNGPKPDLLKDEAQAMITGHLGSDGVFHADELLLKCPTKYQEAVPSQAEGL